MEMVHIGRPIGIDARQQGHHRRELRKIIPVDQDARCARHRHQVQGVVGRAASSEQTDDAIDHGFGIDLMTQADALLAQGDGTLHTCMVQGLTQRRVRVHKGRPGQLQTHDFHQHLI